MITAFEKEYFKYYFSWKIRGKFLKTQSLILCQMLTFDGGLNFKKIEAVGFVTVTLHKPK